MVVAQFEVTKDGTAIDVIVVKYDILELVLAVTTAFAAIAISVPPPYDAQLEVTVVFVPADIERVPEFLLIPL